MKARLIIGAAALAMMCACSSNDGWRVSGTITNAASPKVAVQGFNGSEWYTIDSVSIANDGTFAYAAPQGVAYPDIYRVSLDGQSIYFPLYGTEAIAIEADGNDIEGSYSISGNDDAVLIADIDKRLRGAVAARGIDEVLADSLLKRDLNNAMLADTVGIVAYYILNKSFGGRPLYAANNLRDVAMLGAVAQKFATAMPNDPRAEMLKDQFLNARRTLSAGTGETIALEGDGFIEISLYDDKGVMRNLSETVAAYPIVLVSFTNYQMESSIAYNAELNKVVEAFAQPGLQIYQVSIDDDEVAWREIANNLPWITVRNNPTNGDLLLRHYNVGGVPLTYVIVNGELVERVLDPTQLQSLIRKHL